MKRRFVFLGCVMVLAGVIAGGCDGDGEGDPDAGDPGTDAGDPETDAGGPDLPPVLQAVTARDASGAPTSFGPANFACTPTEPDGEGAAVGFDLNVAAFGMPGTPPVEGLTVQFFPDNVVPTSLDCTGSCVEATSGADGVVRVMDVAGSWYAYRITAGNGSFGGNPPAPFIPVVQFNEVAPEADGDATANAVAQQLQNTIILLLGRTREANTAVVTGTITDCDGNSIVNARVRAFDSAGEIDLTGSGDSDPFEFYFNGAQFPDQARGETNSDGLYGAGNLPVSAGENISIGLYGALEEGDEATLLGCEEVQVIADGITIMNVGASRSDGPTSCPAD